MQITLDQRVFDFLTNDPAFIEGLRHERAVGDVLNRLTPVLEEKLHHLVAEAIEQHLEGVFVREGIEQYVAGIVKGSLTQLTRKVDTLQDEYWKLQAAYRKSEDAADWWKHTGEDADDEDPSGLPF